MAKERSFADKIRKSGKQAKQFNAVKYVKSVISEKTGHYRFQETMLKVPSDMSLDAYLKKSEEDPVAGAEPEGEPKKSPEEVPAEADADNEEPTS